MHICAEFAIKEGVENGKGELTSEMSLYQHNADLLNLYDEKITVVHLYQRGKELHDYRNLVVWTYCLQSTPSSH